MEALPLNSDGGFDSFYFEPIDLGQATTYTEPPINIGSTDPFLGSNFPSVNENTNLLAQNIEQPIDFGSLSSKFLPLDQNSNLLAQNSEQPIDFGSLSSNFLPVDQNSNLVAQTFEQPIDLGSFSSSNPLPNDENSNLLALGQNFQPTTLGETFTFPNSGGGFSTTPEPNFGLQIATAMSCPSGGDFFCCPDKSDENCIPSKSFVFFSMIPTPDYVPHESYGY